MKIEFTAKYDMLATVPDSCRLDGLRSNNYIQATWLDIFQSGRSGNPRPIMVTSILHSSNGENTGPPYR